jgi:hypothetical protein
MALEMALSLPLKLATNQKMFARLFKSTVATISIEANFSFYIPRAHDSFKSDVMLAVGWSCRLAGYERLLAKC